MSKDDFSPYAKIALKNYPTKYAYTALINKAKNDNMFCAKFLDLNRTTHYYFTIEDCIANLPDFLGQVMLYCELAEEKIKEPTAFSDVIVEPETVMKQLVVADMRQHRRAIIKMTNFMVTIPLWLKQKADDEGIDVNNVLENALIDMFE